MTKLVTTGTNSRTASSRRFRRHAMGTVGAAALCLTAQIAEAQDVTQNASASSIEQVVVTGSQVAREGFVSPTPVTTLTAADLQRVGASNIADAINQLPALKASITPTSVTNLSAAAGGNFLDLRGLDFQRTLTLIDGKRYVPSTTTGAVDINIIPQALIGSVDVVTGGASAAYGSDAVAGVVNLKLDNALEGFRASIQGGTTDHADNRNYLASLAFGQSFDGGKGKLLLGAESSDNGGIARLGSRSWGNNQTAINNPAYTASNGQPLYVMANNGQYSNASYGGVINSPTLLKGTQFLPGGTTAPFTYGTNLTSTQMDGGSGASATADNVLETPLHRYSGYAGATYLLSPGLTAYGNIGYGRSSFNEDNIIGTDQVTIKSDNAYLPASISTVMAANKITSFVLGRSLNDYGRGHIDQEAGTVQGVVGLKGDILDDWTFDVSYTNGRTDNRTHFTGDRNTANFNLATDAVVNPATGGIVCRSTLTAPTNGCVPLNLFGVGSASPAAISYISGTSTRDWQIAQQVLDGVVRGSPVSTWAGPVAVAFGGQWRRESANVSSDPLSVLQSYRVGNVIPYQATVSVGEGFGETVIPLANDVSWAKSLDFDLAGRVTNYSTSGTVETWKMGLDYAINDSLRLRSTFSHDIRAPSIDDLFSKGATLIYSVTDPVTNTTATANGITSGNPNLKPEGGNTFTGGVVFTPDFVPSLSLSLDYYHIKLNNAINTLTAQAIVTGCYTTTPSLCPLITRTNGVITSVSIAPANFQAIETSGVDFEGAYQFPLLGGNLNLHSLVTYTNQLDLINSGTVTQFAGDTEQPILNGIGGQPFWRFTNSATFSEDNYSVSVTGRYVGGGVISRTYNYFNGASISGRLYTDLSGSIGLLDVADGKLSLFGSIINLFDLDPPLTGIGGYDTTRSLYDVIGRQYNLGLRYRL